MKALIWFMECSIIILAYNGKFGETVKCYHCEVENENCADPLNPEAEGVQICEGEFCIKSSTTYQGIPVAMRFCSDRARVDNSCVTEVVQGIPAEGCACSEDFCNGPQVLPYVKKGEDEEKDDGDDDCDDQYGDDDG